MHSVNIIVGAARNADRNLEMEGSVRPKNCHEAVLGWLLLSLGYPKPWSLLRRFVIRENLGGIEKQIIGPWMWKNIYPIAMQVDQSSVVTHAREGDILYSGTRGDPTHSMVVVYKDSSTVKIRGFNNAGTFLHCKPTPPRAEYDDLDRQVNNDQMWIEGNFGAGGGDLFWVRHQDARQNTANTFPWKGSAVNGVSTREPYYYEYNHWNLGFPYG